MDAPRQPDGPPIRDGLPYSRIAHLAEDVRPFSAIGRALRGAGLSAPEILAEDLDAGLMLIEDLGDRVYSAEVARDAGLQEELWRGAVDVLVKLRTVPAPRQLPLLDGSDYPIPSYDRGAMQIEVELLLDWYWPALHGERVPPEVRAEFLALWGDVFDRLQQEPPACVLRDFHSPNLLWLPDRAGLARVGIIDFQDAQRGSTGYDLASLLQDARVDVPEALEARLLEHYLQRGGQGRPGVRRRCVQVRLCRARCTAKYQDPRHFRAVVTSRRQGAVSGASAAHLADTWSATCAIRGWPGWRRGTIGYFPAERAPARCRPEGVKMGVKSGGGHAVLDTAMVLSAGLGTRMAPANGKMPEAAGAAARQAADRSRARPAGGGRREARRRQRASHGRPDRAAPQGPPRARHRDLRRAGGAARHRRRRAQGAAAAGRRARS